MANGDFTAKKLTQGRITNMRTGVSRPFSINPHTIKNKGGAKLAEDEIPGFADPLFIFASGKAKTYTMTLEIDGEMTLRKQGVQVTNNVHPQRSVNNTFDISGELEWYESLTYPSDPQDPVVPGDGGLDRVLLTVGNRIEGIMCFVDEWEEEIIEFAPDLNPTKAKVTLTFKRVSDTNRYSNTVFS